MALPVKAAHGSVVGIALMTVKAHAGALQFAVEGLVWVIKLRGCAIKREVGGARTVAAVKRLRGGWRHGGVSDERELVSLD